MRMKPIDIITAARTIDNYSVEDAKGVLIQLLNSHPAIVTRIVNTDKEIVEEIDHSLTPVPNHDDKLCKVVIRKINSKILAIKMVRAVTGAGLKEAKEFIEGASHFNSNGLILSYGVIAEGKTHLAASGIMADASAAANSQVTLEVIPQDAPYKYSF